MTFLISHKDLDTMWVAKVLTDRNLNQNPNVGFANDPVYWQETTRWRRSVEKYSWGAILFLLDREGNRGATVIAIGKLDLDLGRVTVQGGHRMINLTWYHDMVQGLREAASPATLDIPPCLGFREADITCDGGLNREHKKVEPVCAWRNRCMALQDYAAHEGKIPERIMSGKSPSQIVQLTTRLLERTRSTAPPDAAPAPAPKPAPATPKATPVPRALAKLSDGARARLVEKLHEAVKEIASAAGLQISPDWTEVNALPGDLYVIDRLERSGYISLYQRLAGNKSRALAAFRVRPRDGIFNVQLPVVKDSEHVKGIRAEEVVAHKDGKFLCMVRSVQPDTTRMAHIKYAIHCLLAEES